MTAAETIDRFVGRLPGDLNAIAWRTYFREHVVPCLELDPGRREELEIAWRVREIARATSYISDPVRILDRLYAVGTEKGATCDVFARALDGFGTVTYERVQQPFPGFWHCWKPKDYGGYHFRFKETPNKTLVIVVVFRSTP